MRKGKRMRLARPTNKYANGGYAGVLSSAGAIANAYAQEEDGTVDVGMAGLGTAAQYAGYGASLGPVGAIVGAGVGAVVGGIQANKQNERVAKQRRQTIAAMSLADRMRSRGILSHYDEAGSDANTSFYRKGGIQLKRMGGVETQLASNVTKVTGRTHAQGGIHVNGAEVEDDEVGYHMDNATVWFSDNLKDDNGKTFAKNADKIGKELGDAESKLSGNYYNVGTGTRNIEKARIRMQGLASRQTMQQLQRGINPYGQRGENGIIVTDDEEQATDDSLINPDIMYRPPAPSYLQPANTALPYAGSAPTVPQTAISSRANTRNSRENKRAAKFYDRNSTYDTDNDGVIDANERATMRSSKQAAFSKRLDAAGEAVTPFVDNAVNAILTARTPAVPNIIPAKAVPLKTDYSIEEPLANIRRSVRSVEQSIRQNTVNSAAARSNIIAANVTGMEAANKLYDTKINNETQLENQSRQNIQNVANANIGAMNNKRSAEYQRALGIQGRISENVSNMVEDFRIQQRDKNQKRMDVATIALMEKRFNDNGVYDRTMQGYVQELLSGGDPNTVLDKMETHLKTTEKPTKAKSK